MNIKEFDKKYRSLGGFAKLLKMRTMLFPISRIAKQFRVSSERVRQWMVMFFGEKYDPREQRKAISDKSKKISEIYKNK